MLVDEGEKSRVKAISQLDAVRKTSRRKPSGGDKEEGDDAFKEIEPEIDELFAMDEQLVRVPAYNSLYDS